LLCILLSYTSEKFIRQDLQDEQDVYGRPVFRLTFSLIGGGFSPFIPGSSKKNNPENPVNPV
jgi:hypothetical protein